MDLLVVGVEHADRAFHEAGKRVPIRDRRVHAVDARVIAVTLGHSVGAHLTDEKRHRAEAFTQCFDERIEGIAVLGGVHVRYVGLALMPQHSRQRGLRKGER